MKIALIGRPDILWSVNKFARSITNGPGSVTNDPMRRNAEKKSGNFIYRHHVEPRANLHSPRGIIPYNTWMYPELLIRIWMSSKRNVSMIIGISMGLEISQILGLFSHKLLHWKKDHLTDIHGPGGD